MVLFQVITDLFLLFTAAPLVNIKKALSQIKSEIIGMDVRVGVLEHSLLQARLRDKNLLQQDMNAPPHVLV
jgi:estrogen-related receptor beta like 1